MKPTNETDVTEQPEAIARGSLQQLGSDEAYNDPLRQRVIRLVLQISDTPTNRLTMLKCEGAIKALNAGIEGHGVLKREEIIIASLEVPAPRPNVELCGSAGREQASASDEAQCAPTDSKQ